MILLTRLGAKSLFFPWNKNLTRTLMLKKRSRINYRSLEASIYLRIFFAVVLDSQQVIKSGSNFWYGYSKMGTRPLRINPREFKC